MLASLTCTGKSVNLPPCLLFAVFKKLDKDNKNFSLLKLNICFDWYIFLLKCVNQKDNNVINEVYHI